MPLSSKILTLVIPCFNVENKIEVLLLSLDKLLNSKCTNNVEVIFIDDGSTDDTNSILVNFSKKFSNTTVIKGLHEGVSVARNIGISKAKSKYISFIDADDNFIVESMVKVIAILKKDNYDIFNVSSKVKYNRLEKSPRKIIPALFNIKNAPFVEEYHPGLMSKFYNLVFLKANNIKFSTNLSNGEDVQFNIDCLTQAKNVYFYNETLYLYRVGQEDSLSGKKGRNEYPKEASTKLEYAKLLYKRKIINKNTLQFFLLDIMLSKFTLFYGYHDVKEFYKEEIKDIHLIKDLFYKVKESNSLYFFKESKRILLRVLVYIPSPASLYITKLLVKLRKEKNMRKIKWVKI